MLLPPFEAENSNIAAKLSTAISMASHSAFRYLFGGERSWTAADWVASDDRVRGGKSQSYLTPEKNGTLARFHGTLDIKTLGGAGFASQRTVGEERTWDLSTYDGIRLAIAGADGSMLPIQVSVDRDADFSGCWQDKQYTLTLKDSLLPPSPDGREQSTVSYEYDFKVDKSNSSQKNEDNVIIDIPWASLKATYRGREKKDAPGINLKEVVRFSIMMRSFFGTQEGDFDILVQSISATKLDTAGSVKVDAATSLEHDSLSISTIEKAGPKVASRSPGLLARLCSCFTTA